MEIIRVKFSFEILTIHDCNLPQIRNSL